MKKYIKLNENENATYNLLESTKVVLRGKFIALNIYVSQEEKSQINNLSSPLKKLEKERQNKPKASQRKEIINVKAEISEIENRKNNREINKTKLVL